MSETLELWSQTSAKSEMVGALGNQLAQPPEDIYIYNLRDLNIRVTLHVFVCIIFSVLKIFSLMYI